MSVGDAKRREASVRITKLEQERDIADKLSFEPKLHQGAVASRLSQVVDGKLRITSEPETYVVTSSLSFSFPSFLFHTVAFLALTHTLHHVPSFSSLLTVYRYVTRLRRQNTASSLKMTKLRQAEDEKEFEECTFTPMIKDSPAYVKRIAQSMAAQKTRRALTNGEEEDALPTWR